MESGDVAEVLNHGTLVLLRYLYDDQKTRKKRGARFKELQSQTRISSATLDRSLKILLRSELISLSDKEYTITPRGSQFVEIVLENAELLLRPLAQNFRKIDSSRNPHDLQRAAADIAIGAQHELLMSTRRLGSLEKSDVRAAADQVFSALKLRGVTINILADPNLPEQTRLQFVNDFGAQVKFLPTRLLERPPGILKPLMLEDFAHVMIVDQKDWLYIRPHGDESSHVGVSCLNDAITAKYLRSIFQAMWTFASPSIADSAFGN